MLGILTTHAQDTLRFESYRTAILQKMNRLNTTLFEAVKNQELVAYTTDNFEYYVDQKTIDEKQVHRIMMASVGSDGSSMTVDSTVKFDVRDHFKGMRFSFTEQKDVAGGSMEYQLNAVALLYDIPALNYSPVNVYLNFCWIKVADLEGYLNTRESNYIKALALQTRSLVRMDAKWGGYYSDRFPTAKARSQLDVALAFDAQRYSLQQPLDSVFTYYHSMQFSRLINITEKPIRFYSDIKLKKDIEALHEEMQEKVVEGASYKEESGKTEVTYALQPFNFNSTYRYVVHPRGEDYVVEMLVPQMEGYQSVYFLYSSLQKNMLETDRIIIDAVINDQVSGLDRVE